MRRFGSVGVLVGVAAIAFACVTTVFAQDDGGAGAGRGPQFLVALGPSQPPVPVDAASVPVLRRRVSLDLKDVDRAAALDAISRASGLRLVYANGVTLREGRVQLKVEGITVAAALTEVLLDAGVDVLLARSGNAVLMKRTTARVPMGGTITGLVTDAKVKQGIARAEVFFVGTRWRALTDTNGRYRIPEVEPRSYTLMVRRFGYAKQGRTVTVSEGKTDTVDVIMEPMATRLNEIVSTATGPRRRIDIANDVTTINADSVMQVAPIRNLTDLLDTRVPGLTVQRTSGAPGDPARLRLRGAASALGSNDPIVIVDGVRMYAEQSAARSANLATPPGTQVPYAAPSPLDNIDPNTIETIDIIKGPSAATLYGADAANGVIVVTTKRGRAGPTRWTVSAEQGRTQMEGDYPSLSFRAGHTLFTNVPTNCPISGSCVGDSLLTFQLLSDPSQTVLGPAHRTMLSLGASGGSQNLTYAITGSYRDELGLLKLPAAEVDRYQARWNLAPPDWMQRPDHLKQWQVQSTVAARLGATADVALSASLARTSQQRSSLGNQLGTLMSTYYDPVSNAYYQASAGRVTTIAGNPLASYYQRVADVQTQFRNSATFNWRPRAWLTVNADAGVDLLHRADQQFNPRGLPQGSLSDTLGSVSNGQGTSVLPTVNARTQALAPLGHGFQFRASAGINYTSTSTRDLSAGSTNLPPGTSLQGATTTFLTTQESSNATFGWYLEPSVGNSKFNFSSGIRLDRGSGFGSNVGFPNPVKLITNPLEFLRQSFPKLGFSYLVSDESWFPLKTLVQSLRLRVSFGKASRQPNPGDRLRLFTIPQQGLADSLVTTNVFLQTLGNTELRPERTGEFEGGIDADLLDNRLSLVITGYRKTTEDALQAVPVAPSVYGAGVSQIKNIGVIRNTGIDLVVGTQWIRSGSVTWGTQLAIHRERDLVVKLGSGVTPYYTNANGFANSDGTVLDYGSGLRAVPGYPLFGRWSRPILGYADANSNGVLEPNEIQVADTAVYVGATTPNYAAALSTTVGLWHGSLTFNAAFEYQDGLTQLNTVAQQLGVFSRGQQDPAASLAEQAATAYLGGYTPASDYNWIQTVNTLRFNSVSVNYRLPTPVARRLGAQSLNVSVQGGNLGLWTNYRALDPNVNAFGTGNDVTDTGVLPQPRTWQLHVSATY